LAEAQLLAGYPEEAEAAVIQAEDTSSSC